MRVYRRGEDDGWLQFVALPDACDHDDLPPHIEKLEGARVELFIPEWATEGIVSFTYRGHEFHGDTAAWDWRFSVKDPSCPDGLLLEVARHLAVLLR